MDIIIYNRRRFLSLAAMSAAYFAVPGLYAAELTRQKVSGRTRTPQQTEGPFYPDKLPLDTDNDLIIINDAITPAVGTVTHLSGHILTVSGSPIRNATVEIWQVDNNGAYLHTGSDNGEKRDKNFQGFGRFETGSNGEYKFRTIKPVPYGNRTRHIHMMVKAKGMETLATQCYVEGEPLNDDDWQLNAVRNPKERAMLVVPFTPLKSSRIGELAARFDVVMG